MHARPLSDIDYSSKSNEEMVSIYEHCARVDPRTCKVSMSTRHFFASFDRCLYTLGGCQN